MPVEGKCFADAASRMISLANKTILRQADSPVRLKWHPGFDNLSLMNRRIRIIPLEEIVNFISLEDLIKNKSAVGRNRDLLDVKYLERVRKAKKTLSGRRGLRTIE
jgi:hypothetical protein